MKKQWLLLFVLLCSCKSTPEPIQYGTDGCHYCSMTIVDRQHAAQLLTEKGRAYKFDSIECMVNHLLNADVDAAMLLVNDYNDPGMLIDATKASYLIDQNIPSPMGAFLSAFTDKESALFLLRDPQGKVLDWQQLKGNFKKD